MIWWTIIFIFLFSLPFALQIRFGRFPRQSLLFVIPDYHNTFFLRDALRDMGWRADIYVPYWYDPKILYSNDAYIFTKPKTYFALMLKNLIWLIWALCRYDYFYIYAADTLFPLPDQFLRRFLRHDFRLDLALAKFFRKRLVFHHCGCYDIESKAHFSKLDHGLVCENCGAPEKACNDVRNNMRFDVLRRYIDVFVSDGSTETTQYPVTAMACKSIDLDLWSPDLVVPQSFIVPKKASLRVMHSFYDKDRKVGGKNVKGSPHVAHAVDRLIVEGYDVEYFFINEKPSRDMRFYQAQADIIVEQLFYGWWGSTGVETMALGKPVVCYLRPQWVKNFLKYLPDGFEIPVVNATPQTVYDVLKELITNEAYRHECALKSRQFATARFNPVRNAAVLSQMLLGLDGRKRRDKEIWPNGILMADGVVIRPSGNSQS